jgi:hypothetical protein
LCLRTRILNQGEKREKRGFVDTIYLHLSGFAYTSITQVVLGFGCLRPESRLNYNTPKDTIKASQKLYRIAILLITYRIYNLEKKVFYLEHTLIYIKVGSIENRKDLVS